MNVQNVSSLDAKTRAKKRDESYALESIGAYMGAGAVSGLISATGPFVLGAAHKIGHVPADTVQILHNAAEEALKVSGMAAKGVKIQYLKEPATKKGLWGMMSTPNPIEQIKNGFNACFLPKGIKNLFGEFAYKPNTILMPEKEMSFAAFHEIGHSINWNTSKFWRTMQKMRMPGMVLASLPMLYGAFSKKSVAEDGKELTKKQKLNNFIRDNAGKLSFAAMLPMLAEEGMATIRGQKLANKILSPDLAKHVMKGSGVCYLSYLGAAAAVAVGSYAAVKIKDYLVNRKQAKNAEQVASNIDLSTPKVKNDVKAAA